MKTRKKRRFWAKILAFMLIASMMVGSMTTSSFAAAIDTEVTDVEEDVDEAVVPETEESEVQSESESESKEAEETESTPDIDLEPEEIEETENTPDADSEPEKVEETENITGGASDAVDVASAGSETTEGVVPAMENMEISSKSRLAARAGSTGHTCNLYVGSITVDKDNKQTDYIYPKKTTFTCVNTQSHSTNATHGYAWSDIKSIYPGAIGYTRQSPSADGTKISVSPLPSSGSLQTTNGQTVCLVFREITYKVTYDANGGSFPDGEREKVFDNLKSGDRTPAVADPIRVGYTFEGWNPTVAATVTKNVTYTATTR